MSKELKAIGKLKAINEDTVEIGPNECYTDEDLFNEDEDLFNEDEDLFNEDEEPINDNINMIAYHKNRNFSTQSTIELRDNKCYLAESPHTASLGMRTEEEHIVANNDDIAATMNEDSEDDYDEDVNDDDDSNEFQEYEDTIYKKDEKLVNQTSRVTAIMAAMIVAMTVSLLITIAVTAVAFVEIAKIKEACQTSLNEENRTQSKSLKSIQDMANIIAHCNKTTIHTENQNQSECHDSIPNTNITQFETRVSNLAELFSYPVTSYGNQAQVLIFDSCSDVNSLNLPSGYYLLQTSTETVVKVYCDMTLSCGELNGGWIRVANMDFNNSTTPCPRGMRKSNYKALSCKRYDQSPGCTLITVPVQGVQYSRVCGKVIGIQRGSPDGFAQYNYYRELYGEPRDLDSTYLDGVSITHGRYTHHIWSLVAVFFRHQCSCEAGKPSFVDNNFSCDTDFGNYNLWDGVGCSSAHNHEWFYRDLSYSTSDNIEVRLCRDEVGNEEDVLLQLVEIYIQ